MNESAHETREEEQKSGEMDKNGRNQGGGLKRDRWTAWWKLQAGEAETQCRRPLNKLF